MMNIIDKLKSSSSTFVIAEIGCNFEGDMELAKEMIVKAKESVCDAAKFQTFIPEKLVTRTAPKFWEISGCPGETQYDEFKQMPQLNFEQYKDLKKVADDCGIIFFSTPSDEESADMLDEVGVPLFKIASMDLTHIPLLKHIAKKSKPIILSTGMSTIDEIKTAIDAIKSEGNNQIILLHCITNYPTQIEDANLNMILDIKQNFPEYIVGYSDHTKMPESLAIITAAVGIGARVIEKHFTFDKTRPGYDHEISADYEDMKRIVESIRTIEKALGSSIKKPTLSEEKVRHLARRSIVARTNIPKGTVITKDMLDIKRPGTGLEPRFLYQVIGKKAKKDIKEDTLFYSGIWSEK